MAGGLTEDQRTGELVKMVEFIKKEAEEKAKEITIKADEEYEAEKSSLVRSETAAIDQQFSLRYKQSKLAEQIVKSTITNKIRLKVLQAKEETVDKVIQEAVSQLKDLPKDAAKYEKFLAGLIVEASELLKESEVVVTARKSDADAVSKAAKAAAETYKQKTGSELKVDIDTENLPESVIGGVSVSSIDKKISVDNSLDARLKLLVDKSLPLIRLELFGPSHNRRFFD